MKKLLILVVFVSTISQAQTPELKAAVDYLNDVRNNPSSFMQDLGDWTEGISPIHSLTWNKELGKAAQEKAEDMARRNYFGHINPEGYGMNYFINKNGYTLDKDWLTRKEDNFFESLCAGVKTPKEAIRILLIDAGVPSLGHRKHLLGMEKMWSGCYDIGIGWAKSKSSSYSNYYCVLIAKHTWTKSTNGGSVEYYR